MEIPDAQPIQILSTKTHFFFVYRGASGDQLARASVLKIHDLSCYFSQFSLVLGHTNQGANWMPLPDIFRSPSPWFGAGKIAFCFPKKSSLKGAECGTPLILATFNFQIHISSPHNTYPFRGHGGKTCLNNIMISSLYDSMNWPV